jgi:hypothetical protein
VKLYRKFKLDADGKPKVGTKFGMLGVRPRDPNKPNKYHDVSAAQGSDQVRTKGGGLSVFEDPTAIQIHDDDLILCAIDTEDLPKELTAEEAGPPHYQVEPAKL